MDRAKLHDHWVRTYIPRRCWCLLCSQILDVQKGGEVTLVGTTRRVVLGGVLLENNNVRLLIYFTRLPILKHYTTS